MTNIEELKVKFNQIKNEGWIKSVRKGDTGVGATFEYKLGKKEDNLSLPDFKGIEIKTQRYFSKANITLFDLTPSFKDIRNMKDIPKLYGYPDNVIKSANVLSNEFYANKYSLISNRFYFKLIVNREDKKIYLEINDKEGVNIEHDRIYWDFCDLEKKFKQKLNIVAVIYSYRKFIDYLEYFKYYKMTIYRRKSFEELINCIEDGTIKVKFQLAVFRSGRRLGKQHNHGTSFQISRDDMYKLFDRI